MSSDPTQAEYRRIVNACRASLFDLLSRAWQLDPDPRVDPGWLAARLKPAPRPPSDQKPSEPDALFPEDAVVRLRQQFGDDWEKKLVSGLLSALLQDSPELAAGALGANELLDAHTVYLCCYAACRYRPHLLRGRLKAHANVSFLYLTALTSLVDLLTTRDQFRLGEWRGKLPPDGATWRVGSEHGPSAPEAVSRMSDRLVDELSQRLMPILKRKRSARLLKLLPRKMVGTADSPTTLIDRLALWSAWPLIILPDAPNAKATWAEIERRLTESRRSPPPPTEQRHMREFKDKWFTPLERDGLLDPGLFASLDSPAVTNDSAAPIATARPADEKTPVRRDKRIETRDKWVYEQCCKGTPHDRIVAHLKKMATGRKWPVVSSKQRIQQIGNEYADRHQLPRPTKRRDL